jgi:hypothetical protein
LLKKVAGRPLPFFCNVRMQRSHMFRDSSFPLLSVFPLLTNRKSLCSALSHMAFSCSLLADSFEAKLHSEFPSVEILALSAAQVFVSNKGSWQENGVCGALAYLRETQTSRQFFVVFDLGNGALRFLAELRSVPACACLCLSVPACACLCLPVPSCVCSVCLCLSKYAHVCLCMSFCV